MIERRLVVDLVDYGGRPEEQDVVHFSLGVDADLELGRVVRDDLALGGDLFADQNCPNVRLDELRLTHVADTELKNNQDVVAMVEAIENAKVEAIVERIKKWP